MYASIATVPSTNFQQDFKKFKVSKWACFWQLLSQPDPSYVCTCIHVHVIINFIEAMMCDVGDKYYCSKRLPTFKSDSRFSNPLSYIQQNHSQVFNVPHPLLLKDDSQHGYVTSSHLRSKEFISIHKPCIPHSTHSRDTTKRTLVYIQMQHRKVVAHQTSTTL